MAVSEHTSNEERSIWGFAQIAPSGILAIEQSKQKELRVLFFGAWLSATVDVKHIIFFSLSFSTILSLWPVPYAWNGGTSPRIEGTASACVVAAGGSLFCLLLKLAISCCSWHHAACPCRSWSAIWACAAELGTHGEHPCAVTHARSRRSGASDVAAKTVPCVATQLASTIVLMT
eukprot:1148017-Pelagomonas_calceolata.AAC.1